MSQNRPHAPTPSEAAAQLIDDLGGPTKVAEIIKTRLGYEFTPQAISNHKRRGIPYAYRACLAIEARERDIGVPAGFLGEGELPPPPAPDATQPQTAV